MSREGQAFCVCDYQDLIILSLSYHQLLVIAILQDSLTALPLV